MTNWLQENLNTVIEGNHLDILHDVPDGSIDLTVTSPPYDDLRDYEGYNFKFEPLAKELFRVTKKGGVVVWVVGDATINGSETGTSFRQALYFKEIGFNLHDTMIWYKPNPVPQINPNRYWLSFEHMFVFSTGSKITFNPIMRLSKSSGKKTKSSLKQITKSKERIIKEYVTVEQVRENNTWIIPVGSEQNEHPAYFPEKLASKHIISWSNENDIILDPMCGSGTTCKMAMLLNRNYIGIDCSKKYVEIARKRIHEASRQMRIF